MSFEIKAGMRISAKELRKLGEADYQAFRERVKAAGFSVSDGYGNYRGAVACQQGVVLDMDGDLMRTSDDTQQINDYFITADEIWGVLRNYSLANLKNGQLVWFKGNPKPYTFYKDVVTTYYSGDVFVQPGSINWSRASSLTDTIVKVANQNHPFNLVGVKIDDPVSYPVKVVWELPQETEQERQIKELQETIRKAQAQIDELAKAV